MNTTFIRVGRIILNLDEITKVTRDGQTREVTVVMKDGTTSTFKKHGQALWMHMKSLTTAQIIGQEDDADDSLE